MKIVNRIVAVLLVSSLTANATLAAPRNEYHSALVAQCLFTSQALSSVDAWSPPTISKPGTVTARHLTDFKHKANLFPEGHPWHPYSVIMETGLISLIMIASTYLGPILFHKGTTTNALIVEHVNGFYIGWIICMTLLPLLHRWFPSKYSFAKVRTLVVPYTCFAAPFLFFLGLVVWADVVPESGDAVVAGLVAIGAAIISCVWHYRFDMPSYDPKSWLSLGSTNLNYLWPFVGLFAWLAYPGTWTQLIHLGPGRLPMGFPLAIFTEVLFVALTFIVVHHYFHIAFDKTHDLSREDGGNLASMSGILAAIAGVSTVLAVFDMETLLGLRGIESLVVVTATAGIFARLYFVLRPRDTPLISRWWIRLALHVPFLLLAAQWWFGIFDHPVPTAKFGTLALSVLPCMVAAMAMMPEDEPVFRRWKITRATFVRAGLIVLLGTLLTVKEWAPWVGDLINLYYLRTYSEPQIRKKLNDSLVQLNYFFDDMADLRWFRVPPELEMDLPDLLQTPRRLADLIRTGELEIIPDRRNPILFSVDVLFNRFRVNIRFLDLLIGVLNNVLFHEATHLTRQGFQLEELHRKAARQIMLILRFLPVNDDLENQKTREEGAMGRSLTEVELLEKGLWDITAILRNSELRALIKEFLSARFRDELNAYTAQLALLSRRARVRGITLNAYLDELEKETLKTKASRFEAILRKWFGFGPPPGAAFVQELKVLAKDFRDDALTPRYLNAVIRHLLEAPTAEPWKRELAMVALAEFKDDFDWSKAKGDDDSYTGDFFEWVRPWIFRLDKKETAHVDSPLQRPLEVAA